MANVYAQTPAAASEQRRRGFAWVVYTWLPVVVMTLAIVMESTHTFSANNTSSWLRRLFGIADDAHWQMIHHYIRKTGHFTGYGLMAATSLRAWMLTLARRLPTIPIAAWRWRSAFLSLCITIFIASCDELHQSFMPDRTGTIWDVLLDSTGGIVFLLVIVVIFWTWSDPSGRKSS